MLRDVLVHRFLIAALHCMTMYAWHMPAHARVQCSFKSFALRSCQCGRKTLYGLEFWSLDLPSARVGVWDRVPALVGGAGRDKEKLSARVGNRLQFHDR